MTFHKNLGLGDIHVPYNWQYANETARLAATDFDPADVGKLAFQTDNQTIWILSNHSPVVWKGFSATATSIETSFDFNDALAGEKLIGVCLAGKIVLKTVVIITTEFDDIVLITVGDAAAQGRLVVAADVNSDQTGTYDVDSNYKYVGDTEITIYFSGTPTQGAGQVIAYLA